MSEKVPSGRSSPRKEEKVESNSSRESEISIHFDFDSEPLERIRPSSWDESDDDLLPDNTGSSEQTQVYSTDSQKLRASVAAEIHELRKQFFESLQKLKDSKHQPIENVANITPEDRRQCPARVRRRTKSSSSLSPVLESKSHTSSEKLSGLDEVYDEVSSKIQDFDPKYYLNNFFNDLRMKRISVMDTALMTEKTEDEESDWREQDGESTPLCNDLSSDSNENDERFCPTFRKLSQIIEVEETKKDLEKSSEVSENSALFSKSLKNPEDDISPLQTARSRSEKNADNLEETKKQNFKSLSFEEFGNFQRVQNPFQGSFSERTGKFYNSKPNSMLVTSPKPRTTSPILLEDKHGKSPSKVVSFSSQIEETEVEPSQESSSKEDEKENLDLINCLKIDLMKNSASQTPRSSDRSELSRSARSRSGKSRYSNPESPKFRVNIDSERSLKVEDVNSPDSLQKEASIDVETQSKTGSVEDCTPGKPRSFRISENNSDRNYQIPVDSSSLESVKSSSSKEIEINSSKSQKSKSTARSQRMGSSRLESDKPTESYSKERSRSYERPPSRVASPTLNNSHRRTKTPNIHSNKSSRSDTRKTPKTPQEKYFAYSFEQQIQTPDLTFPLDISESQKSSGRSTKTETKNKRSSRRSSDSSLKSKNTESARTTPRTNDSGTSRSKESLENQKEFDPDTWKELENMNEVLSNRSSRNSSRKSSWRTHKTATSPKRGTPNPDLDDSDTPKADYSEKSGKTTRRSLESARNSSPTKSVKSQASEERKYPNVHADIEKLYLEVASEIIRNKISAIEDDEEVKETPSSQRLKSESESDRYSEKRLSIINEVSFEDLEISNESNENEENSREQSQNSSTRDLDDVVQSGGNQRKTNEDEQTHGKDGGKWNELIETFDQNPNSYIIEGTLAEKAETTWGTVKEVTDTDNEGKEKQSAAGNKYDTSEKYFAYENETEEKEEDAKNFNLEYEEKMGEKGEKKEMNRMQNFHNLYYVNVNVKESGIFGIGECGDVRNWNADKSDTPDKPKDHGDGIQFEKTSQVLAILEKKEKEGKTQRHLWTDLKGDFRTSRQKLEMLFSELGDHVTPTAINSYKSEESNSLISPNEIEYKYEIGGGGGGGGGERIKNTKKRDFSVESLEEEMEFECETPRRSRSMIDLNTRLHNEKLEDVKLNQNFNSSGSELFERARGTSKGEKESTKLNIFLARNQKEEKTPAKTNNNWLNVKTFDMDYSNKKEKKNKKKRKTGTSANEKYKEYLTTGKSRSSIPPLKLRNPNCFQNFYKRIVSVFCLTSHSSVATSK